MTSLLLVEDDSHIRTAYAYALTRAGYEVVEAGDGAQAAAFIEQSHPDVVILDMLMPGMSGLDFLRSTKAAKRFPDTKIIAFSNIDTPRVIKEAKELGVKRYVIKVDTTPRGMVDLVEEVVNTK